MPFATSPPDPAPLGGHFETQVLDVSPHPTTLHTHTDRHELLWHVRGAMRVEAESMVWQLLPRTAVWIPERVRHRLCGEEGARYGFALIDTDVCPTIWNQPRQIDCQPVLNHLLQHLSSDLLAIERRNAETVALDLLHDQLSSPVAEIPMPSDSRCRAIADALLSDPATDRSLIDWATEVGAGSRTLTRLWVEETGMTFSAWRSMLRLRASIAALAAGADVGVVARRVGYRTTSAFVAAFRRQTGRTPTHYVDAAFPGDEDVEDRPALASVSARRAAG